MVLAISILAGLFGAWLGCHFLMVNSNGYYTEWNQKNSPADVARRSRSEGTSAGPQPIANEAWASGLMFLAIFFSCGCIAYFGLKTLLE